MKKTTWSGSGVPNVDPAKEKRKLILLVVATVMVGGAYFYSSYQSNKRADANRELAPRAEEEEVVTVVELPAIDADAWRATVRDETRLERLDLTREELDLALNVVRRMVPAHYTELGSRDLDAAGVAALLDAPDAERGKAFRARGWVEQLSVRQSPGKGPEYQGLLLLEDAAPVYFVALRVPENLAVGDFTVLDGLFLQRFTEETDDGWLDGPLLVAGEVRRSYPELTDIDWDRVESALAFVEDDSATSGTGRPFEATWTLMAYAAQAERVAADIEWENADELQQGLMKDLLNNPERYRGQAFRIPVSQVMGLTVIDPGENPMRAERITDGWLGNTTWTDVIQFTAPFASDIVWRSEADGRTLAWAHGFFVKPVNYEPQTGGLRQAPFFVLTELVEHHPPPDRTWAILGTIGTGLLATFAAFFAVAWMRDRRKANQLQESLTRRREERRSRTASAPSN